MNGPNQSSGQSERNSFDKLLQDESSPGYCVAIRAPNPRVLFPTTVNTGAGEIIRTRESELNDPASKAYRSRNMRVGTNKAPAQAV